MPEREPGLDVYFRNRLIGRLWLDGNRRFAFMYADDWVRDPLTIPISLSMPLRTEIYADDASRPFFANLLPEGEIRRLIARRFGISEANDYGLLERIGGECAGAVSLVPSGEKPPDDPGYEVLDAEALHRIIEELPRKPLLAGEKGIRLSLAGAQSKLPVFISGEGISIATGSSPSTHILKPPIPGLEGTVDNEAFCMTLAAQIGLPVPPVSIRREADNLLVIDRYDRIKEPDGTVTRLHQEDFCQALGYLPDQKYEAEGGPSLEECFSLVRARSIQPAADMKALLSWIVFNTVIGNADAHAKNLAILHLEKGPQLAPFYDLLSTQVYPDLVDKYAMKIGGENRPDWLQVRHWERMADSLEIKRRFVLGEVRRVAGRTALEAEKLAEGYRKAREGKAIIEKIVGLIRKRAGRIP
jgi:serine/threonine-protein kinase HipA